MHGRNPLQYTTSPRWVSATPHLICIQEPGACPDEANPLQCGAAFLPKHRLTSASSTPARSGFPINGAVWNILGN